MSCTSASDETTTTGRGAAACTTRSAQRRASATRSRDRARRRGAPCRGRRPGSGRRRRRGIAMSRRVGAGGSGNIAARMLPSVESATSVAVIGAGSWGTTVAAIMSEHTPTTLWGRDAELVDEISDRHENSRYLAGIQLPAVAASVDRARRRVRRCRRRGDGGALARLPSGARSSGAVHRAATSRW